ncbi:ABC1 domain-containing protein [Chloropicon primus]|uniref:ABC1 domain-containing protein n=1 Tax=Chloropicon primus TaxID=1764295 RepID=A0A5B8MVW5_9CHLO|nr:ABC1 domain-containing protein [Chloropicon primus]UPR02823.1 ABC1 domain-containing protein [Chloropicon primus]|eukprot:QDZ23610.1 ABC1 domain-containing protein [Chloropicon primus]
MQGGQEVERKRKTGRGRRGGKGGRKRGSRVLEVGLGLGRILVKRHQGNEEQVRLEIFRLGPVFHKLGQLLGTRPDVVGSGWAATLAPLQDRAFPFPFQEVEEELSMFQFFDETGAEAEDPPRPVGVGSLGQVYRVAPRTGGKHMALKVQRPGALESVRLDCELLQGFVDNMKLRSTLFAEIVDRVTQALLAELDYAQEARNTREFAAVMNEVPEVVVPLPVERYCGERTLAMEWVEGRTPAQLLEAGDKEGLRRLTELAIKSTMAQLLSTNVLHGDPHGGNLMLSPEGKLVYLDFGVLCRITEKKARGLLVMSAHMVNQEWTGLASALKDMEVVGDDTDQAVLGLDFAKELRGCMDQQAINSAMMKLGVKYKFRFPSYYMLLARALAPIEGYGKAADPDFDVMNASYPYVMERLSSADRRKLAEELGSGPSLSLLLKSLLRSIVLAVAAIRRSLKRLLCFFLPRRSA